MPEFLEKRGKEPFLADFTAMNEAGKFQEAFVSFLEYVSTIFLNIFTFCSRMQ